MEADTTVGLYNFYGWLHTNRKRVLAGAVVAAVIAAIAAFVSWNNTVKEAAANQALLAVPSLIGMAPPGDPASAKALLNIGDQYPGTSAGVSAQLLAARELFLGGKYPEAQQQFSKFIADHSTHPLAPQANVGIAAAMEAQGNVSGALQQYKKVSVLYASDPSVIIPVKLTLGRLSEADNKLDQAISYYKDLASMQDPNDPWVVEAFERLRALVSKHPELNPAPALPAAGSLPSVLTPNPSEMQLSPPGSPGPAAAPPAATSNAVPAPQPVVPPQTPVPPAAPPTVNPTPAPPAIPPAANPAPAGNR
jgi:predicted negative regulator of RcsB-dependent stress response